MNKEILIPEGYEARIEGNKVILELKESEDERIRNGLLRHFKNKTKPYWNEIAVKDIIAYLERQKEPELHCGSLECIKCLKEEYRRGCRDTKKEQKPAEDKDAIELTPKQDYFGLTDFERAIHRGFLCAGVENVPVGIIKDTAQDCLAQIKPAEWSEDIIRKAVKEVGLTQHQINWFKNNIFPPKQEWSEEDETAFGDLMWRIEQAKKSAKDENDMGNIWFAETWAKNRLKSLRPSWRPSEEQISALERAIVKMHTPDDISILAELRDILKKLSL